MSNTVELVHTDTGSGDPALVLIHGLCCDLSDWQPQVEHFSKSHRMITPTLRAHGQALKASPHGAAPLDMAILASDVVALLRAKGITQAVVGGHSMGTRVAHEVRRQAPDIVKGLILVDGSDSALGNPERQLSQFEAATAGDKVKPWLKGMFEIMFYGDRFSELKRACVDRALMMPDDDVRSLYRGIINWDGDHADTVMCACDVPTLVLQSTTRGEDGIRRDLRPGEEGHYPGVVRSRIAGAEIHALAGHGHFTSLEAPDWTNEAIADWMKLHGFV
jgi:pimeloyl-ACP methyl ester carboxylesterase